MGWNGEVRALGARAVWPCWRSRVAVAIQSERQHVCSSLNTCSTRQQKCLHGQHMPAVAPVRTGDGSGPSKSAATEQHPVLLIHQMHATCCRFPAFPTNLLLSKELQPRPVSKATSGSGSSGHPLNQPNIT